MNVMSCEQIRMAEEEVLRATKITLFDLVLKAGTGVYKFAKSLKSNLKTVVVLCGNGNNGADGFIAAKMLSHDGIKVAVILMDEVKSPDGKKAFDMLRLTDVSVYRFKDDFEDYKDFILKADICIDAVYGIGFKGELSRDISDFFLAISKLKCIRISVDLPSGMPGDIGFNICKQPDDIVCFIPDYTYTFIALKSSHVSYPSSDFCGEVVLDTLGISKKILDKCESLMKTTSVDKQSSLLQKRKISSNKGDFGTLMCVCGSYTMPGAAVMAAKAATRCGAGLVDVAVPECIYPIVSSSVHESVFTVYYDNKKLEMPNDFINLICKKISKSRACLLGCGMYYSPDFSRLLEGFIKNSSCPLVIDAGGINVLSLGINILKEANCPVVLTPHPGEMARLIKKDVDFVQQNRYNIAKHFSEEYNVILVLKGANTLISFPNGDVFVNRTGNAGMAKAGSGDVLSGMISSMIAAGSDIKDAVISAVYLHGKAGDICKDMLSEVSMTASDIIDALPNVFLQLKDM